MTTSQNALASMTYGESGRSHDGLAQGGFAITTKRNGWKMHEWMKMYGYREQQVCATCCHCFIITEMEPGIEDEYYCTVDGVERPPCGCMGIASEGWNNSSMRAAVIDAERWMIWAKNHLVSGFCVCDAYRRNFENGD